MHTVTELVNFNFPAKTVWDIISDVSRSDWLPTVSKINIIDDYRIFEMEGHY